jgi:murein DD-endopeptidase MepM/ murein hydrolase activator NlpD
MLLKTIVINYFNTKNKQAVNMKKTLLIVFSLIIILNFALANIILAASPSPAPSPSPNSSSSPGASPSPATEEESDETTSQPTLAEGASIKLQIPLLTYDTANNIYEYIGNIYTTALYIIVPITIFIIIMSGLQWVSAGGNYEQIKAAKSLIMRGFIGLGIALLSYTILSFVGITSLSLPGITKIEPGPDEYMDVINKAEGTSTASYGSVGGQCFPVAANSFRYINWNWGDRRSDGHRCHAGIDIYTKSPGHVVAIADGTVTSTGHFYSCKGGWSGPGSVDRVFVNHGSFTVNYGEIDTGKIASGIRTGVQVKAGQVLGVAGHCGMLHFELYQGNKTTNDRWNPGGYIPKSHNYCRDHYMATKPAALLDPTNTIKGLEGKMCGQ